MTPFSLQLSPCGSTEHLTDLRQFAQLNLPVPHSYASWPLHGPEQQWLWVRAVDPADRLLMAFAVELRNSRALPGMRIARISRMGRALHDRAAPLAGDILRATARKIPRVLRLDVHLFDEDSARRERFATAITTAGGAPSHQQTNYQRTLMLPLEHSDIEQLFSSFSSRTRRNLRKTDRQPHLQTAPILSVDYTSRMHQLHAASFERTTGEAPELDVLTMLTDASVGNHSLLLGMFDTSRKPPDDLIAFAWAVNHGDYAVYEHAASERISHASAIAPGAVIMWQLIRWAHQRGARWFDMGGVIPADAPADDPLQGISAFKRGFTRQEVVIATDFSFTPYPVLQGLINSGRKIITGSRTITRLPGMAR